MQIKPKHFNGCRIALPLLRRPKDMHIRRAAILIALLCHKPYGLPMGNVQELYCTGHCIQYTDLKKISKC